MADLILWKDQEISKLRKDLDRLFIRAWTDFNMPFVPGTAEDLFHVEWLENAEAVIFRAALPGLDPDKIEVSVTEDRLIIRGEIQEQRVEQGARYRRISRRHGTFSRSFRLPCRVRVEDARAAYKQGVLQITMPKMKKASSCAIKIKVT